MYISFSPESTGAFKRKIADIEDLTNRYIQKASRLKTLEELIKASSLELHQGLGLTRTLFFIYDEETRGFKKSYDTHETKEDEASIDRHFPLIIWFARNQEILPLNRVYTDDHSFKPIRDEVSDFFQQVRYQRHTPLIMKTGFTECSAWGKKRI
ncbi:MAG: hypothetical protein MZU97_26915 [Bacillus subtilis]|nr:hypothetical protein [Bacillus subtilis]